MPKDVEEMIEEHTNRYGKAKLILQQNKYYIEADASVMGELRKINCIEQAHQRAIRLEKEREEKDQQDSTQVDSRSLFLSQDNNKFKSIMLDNKLNDLREQQNLANLANANNPFYRGNLN